MNDFIFELISEEIPAKMQNAAMHQLERLTSQKVSKAGLLVETITPFVTSMRLGILLKQISSQRIDSIKEIRGPRLGAPENAIEGFLKKNNIKRDDLQEKETDKGEFYVYSYKISKQPLSEILSLVFTEIIREFNWPKSMYWGDNYSLKWVRPLRHIVAVLFENNKRVKIPLEIRNIESDVRTRAHQVMHPDYFEFHSMAEYQQKILEGKVILQPDDRKKRVLQEGKKLAQAKGFYMVEDDLLLDEIVGLTEYPTPIIGLIPKELLLIPEEVIVTSMREHQKFLSLKSVVNNNVEAFLVVSDIEAADLQNTILAGNMRVLISRLKDAIFFYQNDLNFLKRGGMKSWNDKLKNVKFHEKLGSQYDRLERLSRVASLLSEKFQLEQNKVRETAMLVKADLVSELVIEFPSLQGVMGAHYASIEGLGKTETNAIRDHYLPMGPTDEVPKDDLSIVLALSDKIDYLTSLWGAGIKPTGKKDPFALRRAALGIIRIILENNVNINLSYLIKLNEINFEKIELEEFFKERIIYYFAEKGFEKKLVKAIIKHYELSSLSTLPRIIEEISKFISSENGILVLSIHKRVGNFLNANSESFETQKQTSADSAGNEDKLLQSQLASIREEVEKSLHEFDIKSALKSLEGLVIPVNRFLDNVQINCEDKALRGMRYSLLMQVQRIIDITIITKEIEKK